MLLQIINTILVKEKIMKLQKKLAANKDCKTFTRLLCLFCIMLCILSQISLAPTTYAASKPSVHAHAYVIMDANTGKILLSQNATKKIYPASTVKLMTALVVLDKCKTTKKIKITSKMIKSVPYGASKAGIRAGGTYTVNNLLHMLLLPSGADAAMALAYGSYGSVSSFCKAMNQKSKKLGLKKTIFDNPIGLDIGNNYYKTYTTASSFAILARYAMTNPTIRSIVSKPGYRVPKTKNNPSFYIVNTNRFLSTYSYNKKLFTIIGGKTGTTRAAGSVLITSATDNKGHEIICAFFGNINSDYTYSDIKKLLNYTFEQGNAGKLPWKKGFWDVRYRDTEEIIRKYYNMNCFTVSKSFNPTQKASQKQLLTIINKIANQKLKPTDSADTMSILDFAIIYYKAKHPVQETPKPTTTPTPTENEVVSGNAIELTSGSAIEVSSPPVPNASNTSNKTIAVLKKTCKTYKNSSSCTYEELNALSFLIQSKILPSSITKNTNTKITKEQAVLIADSIKKGNYSEP